MSEIQDALQQAARLGYNAAENGENLEDVINQINVKPQGEQAWATVRFQATSKNNSKTHTATQSAQETYNKNSHKQ